MPLTKIVDTFRVDQDGVGGGPFDTNVHVQALTDGGYVYAWRERETGGLEQDRVFVRKFDANGDPVGDQFEIPGAVHEANGHSSFSQSTNLPSIAALEGGAFAVEYNDWGLGTDYSNGNHYSSPWTWTALFDAAGALIDQETPIGLPIQGDPQSNTIWSSAIASDDAGGYHSGFIQAVSYETGPSGNRIVLDGVEVTRHQSILSNATEGYSLSSGSIDVADHADGAIAIYARSYYTGSLEKTDIWAITSEGDEFRVNDAIDGFQQFGATGDFLVQLSNGNYVAVWNDTSDSDEATDPSWGVHARIFRGDGTYVTGDIVLSGTPGGDENNPAVAAMSGGRWIACWYDDAGVVAQVFSATGARIGSQVLIGSFAGDAITLTVLEDDRIVFAFNDGGSTTSSQIWRFPDIFGTEAGETVNGGSGDDVLHGLGGNDRLNGKGGVDEMRGGEGDDTYIAGQAGDFAVELADQGTDTLIATVDHTIGDNVEALVLKGAADQGAGNGGANTISGAGLADTLQGLGGDDVLVGGIGGDSLDGGDGIDAAKYNTKVVVDLQTPGANTGVAAGDTYAGIENLLGSAANDTLRGDAAANLLNGANGNDKLTGRDGDDLLIGHLGSDNLDGGNGADTLRGGTGLDQLKGGPGADRFVLDFSVSGHSDAIDDFASASDQIALLGTAFNLSPGALGAEAFHAGSAAHDADDRIIYHAASGKLFFDADGDGAADKVLIAELADGAALLVSDIVVISDPAAAPLSAGATAFEAYRPASAPAGGIIAADPARHWTTDLSAPGAVDWLV